MGIAHQGYRFPGLQIYSGKQRYCAKTLIFIVAFYRSLFLCRRKVIPRWLTLPEFRVSHRMKQYGLPVLQMEADSHPHQTGLKAICTQARHYASYCQSPDRDVHSNIEYETA